MNEQSIVTRDGGALSKIEPNVEVLAPSATEQMQRAEIDVQISTAHRFPRSMQKFKTRAVEMATLDEETAASCLYSRPVGGGKFAEGLSVRMAEIVGACYGNLRVAATIVEQTERYVRCRGMAHDLETNFASACEVIESTVKKDGTPYDERMRVVLAKACLAKARRDATFQVVPKALCKPIEQHARAVAVGDATTLGKRREQVMTWISKLGIDGGRVFAALGVRGEGDLGTDELAMLTGLKTAIKDGEVTVDEAFPPILKEGAIGAPKSPLSRAKAPPVTVEATVVLTAKDLLSALYAKAKTDLNMSASVLQDRLTDGHFIADELGSLDLAALQGLLDGWEDVKAQIGGAA